MLRFAVLGSGSSGNSALVESSRVRVLIDAGLSARQIGLRLERLGLAIDQVDAILLTHEHGDHVRGLDVLCRRHAIPVYCTALTREALGQRARGETGTEWRIMPKAGLFEIEDITVETFPVMHDAADPVGFTMTSASRRLGVVSDAGHLTKLIVDRLLTAGTVFLEANYDEEMLIADRRRPWPTKQRIQSRHGHLSNIQAAQFVGELAAMGGAIRRVVLGHLSQDCNRPDKAAAAVEQTLRDGGFPEIDVHCACQAEPTPWFTLGPAPEAEPSSVREMPPDAGKALPAPVEPLVEFHRQPELF